MRYSKLGYVALNVTDVQRSRHFYESMVGLQYAGESAGGDVFLRCSNNHHDIILCPAAQPGLKRIAFEMESSEALEALIEHLASLKIRTVEVPEAERKALSQRRTFRISEPTSGATIEFYDYMHQFGSEPYVPTVAKIQRLGHVVIKTPELEKGHAFFKNILGFRVSDIIDDAIYFMRCHPNPYHHTFAVGKGKAPGLHHVNFMVTEVDDIGKAIARFQKNQITVVNGPGRHPPSGSMFFYFLDPDGMTVEYSFGMEEFPEEKPRKPRLLPATTESLDYWDSFKDPRKASIGDIEVMTVKD